METMPALLTLKYSPYFIQTATIKAVKPLYANEVFGINWDVDLSLLLEIKKQNGSCYDYQLSIRGNFKRDSTGRIIGWGSAFKIQKLFNNLSLIGSVNTDGSIDEKCLQQLVGKEIFVLNYVSGLKDDGSVRYQMWDSVAEDRPTIQSDFLKSTDKGYPKNFFPAVLMDKLRDNQVSNTKKSESNNLTFASDDFMDF